MSGELWELSAVDQVRMVRAKQASAREMLASHLARIEEVNPTVNALVALDPSVAEARAAEIDEIIADGRKPGPLAGLVTAHKDLSDTADFVTTYGSTIFEGHRPKTDDLLVARMKKAGAVAVGKSNTPEFGMGSHTFNRVYGMTRNPYNPDRSAGGSSGGAAVALRTGMVSIADGSDLGGSLRNPAGWNNVVGFRASPRVVPVVGPGNAWNPMPIVGPMARNVDDLFLMLRVMSQSHSSDPLSRQVGLPPLLSPPTKPLRVAWSKNLGGLPIAPEVAEVVERFRSDIELLGWDITEDEPNFEGSDECFANLRAFMVLDKFDERAPHFEELKATAMGEFERGSAMSARDVAKSYGHLNILWQRAINFFEDYDLLVAPVTQVSPFPVEQEYVTEINGEPMDTYIDWMRSCTRITTLGCPAMSLPAGFTDEGLPVGIQLIGRPYGDGKLLEAAKALEATTSHGQRAPKL